jgi:hypothetical protein
VPADGPEDVPRAGDTLNIEMALPANHNFDRPRITRRWSPYASSRPSSASTLPRRTTSLPPRLRNW